mgnify:CR=1 FL=1
MLAAVRRTQVRHFNGTQVRHYNGGWGAPSENLGPGKMHCGGVFDPAWKPITVDIAYAMHKSMRRWGVALVKFGDRFMGIRPRETLYKQRRVVEYEGVRPVIKDNCFIAPSAVIVGDVLVGRKATVGYNTIVRGDQGAIKIGESCCVNDKAVLLGNVTLGKWVTIDPKATVDNASVASCSMVGSGSILMKGSRIESNSLLCAASVLQAGATIPSGEIWSGNPAEKLGELSEEEKNYIIKAAKHYVLLNLEHNDAWELTWEEIDNYRIGREHWAIWAEGMFELRVRGFYTREGPKNSGRPVTSPFEVMQGKLQFRGFESFNQGEMGNNQ